MYDSFNNSIFPFFKSRRFRFKGISLRIQWCLKALLANWLNKILKIQLQCMKQIFYLFP